MSSEKRFGPRALQLAVQIQEIVERGAPDNVPGWFHNELRYPIEHDVAVDFASLALARRSGSLFSLADIVEELKGMGGNGAVLKETMDTVELFLGPDFFAAARSSRLDYFSTYLKQWVLASDAHRDGKNFWPSLARRFSRNARLTQEANYLRSMFLTALIDSYPKITELGTPIMYGPLPSIQHFGIVKEEKDEKVVVEQVVASDFISLKDFFEPRQFDPYDLHTESVEISRKCLTASFEAIDNLEKLDYASHVLYGTPFLLKTPRRLVPLMRRTDPRSVDEQFKRQLRNAVPVSYGMIGLDPVIAMTIPKNYYERPERIQTLKVIT